MSLSVPFLLLLSFTILSLHKSFSSATSPPFCSSITACHTCTHTCAPFYKQIEYLQDCTQRLSVAKSKPPSAADLDCRVPACADLLLKTACDMPGVFESLSDRTNSINSPTADHTFLNSRLDAQAKKFRDSSAAYRQHIRRLYDSLTPAQRAYAPRVTPLLTKVHQQFRIALKQRAHLLQGRRLIHSKEFRHIRLQARKLSLERAELRERVKFWRQRRSAVSAAVGASVLAMRYAIDGLEAELAAYQGDAQLADFIKRETSKEDDDADRLITLRTRADEQMKHVQTVTASVRAQRMFIEDSADEIQNFLQDVLTKVKQNELSVPCGPTALSDIVTESLMSSLS